MSKDDQRDENTEKKGGGSSRLGKEAKIGVTVIAVLLLVFGGAVAVRLTGSSADDTLAVAAERDGAKQRPTHESQTDSLSRTASRMSFGGSRGPTVVPAKAASVKPPKTTG